MQLRMAPTLLTSCKALKTWLCTWAWGLESVKAVAAPNLSAIRVQFHGGQYFSGLREMVLVLLTRPPLPFSCEARFLSGHGLVPVCSPGIGDPCVKGVYFLALLLAG